ncbi:MAG: biotin-dependent carboxyltransferase family protein [Pseudomonadota bacterium]
MALEVQEPGLLTTIQDLGRPGYFHLGIPEGGAMDREAFRIGNMLVSNDEGAAGLEAVFVGPKLTFQMDAVVAVTGGRMPIFVDGEEKPGWTSFEVKSGQVLSFGYLQGGARVYICISGGIATPMQLGSRSTYAIGALGGVDGRAIAAGDVLPLGEGAGTAGREAPEALRRGGPKDVLRVVTGLYWHRITPESQKGFFADGWKVAPEADRMGYRFRCGKPLEFVPREPPFGAGSDPSNIVDGCYPYGSIQVPGGTEPIVLHRDAVSGGGYFMIGAIISADMDLIAQMQPHTPVRFEEASMDAALAARKERAAGLAKMREALA